jgi:hypothetical protein
MSGATPFYVTGFEGLHEAADEHLSRMVRQMCQGAVYLAD